MSASSRSRRPTGRNPFEPGFRGAPQPVDLHRVDFDGLALRARTLRSRVVWRLMRRAAGALFAFARPATPRPAALSASGMDPVHGNAS